MRNKLLLGLLIALLAITCLALGEGLVPCEHEYDQTSYQSDDSFHWFVCSKCGKAVEQADHTPACIDHADATATDDGYDLFQCTVCAHEWRTLLPATSALPLTVSDANSASEEPVTISEAPAENTDENGETPTEEQPAANADASEVPAENVDENGETPSEEQPAGEPAANTSDSESPAENVDENNETPTEEQPADEPAPNAGDSEAPAENVDENDETPTEEQPADESAANADASEAPAENADENGETPTEEQPEDNVNTGKTENPAVEELPSNESTIAAPQAGAALLSDTNSDDATDTDKHEHYAVCTAPTKCAVCDVDYAGDDIRHNYIWKWDSDNHWQKCSNSSCGATTSKVAHVLTWTDNGDTHSASCECGYAYFGESHYSPCSTPGYCKCGISYSGDVVHTGLDYDDWKIEGEYHWLLCSTCGEKINYHVHVAACTNQTVCMSCGAECSNVSLAHTLSNDAVWQIEGDYHWKECADCSKKFYYGQHTLTCGSSDNNCSVCGTEYSGANIRHTTSSDWSYDPDYHWHVCSNCNQIFDKGNHYASCDTNGICNGCGSPYTATNPGHYFDGVYESNETYHWQLCSKCGSKVNEVKHYTYCNDASGQCHECGKSYSNLRIEHYIDWDNIGSDELYHWYKCKYEGCTAQIDKELHYRSCVSGTKCKQCGEKCTSTSISHNTSSDTYQSDENYHWNVCADCNTEVYKSSHSAFCSDRTKCAQCGRISSNGDYEFYHPYLGATVFESDATHHWRTCEACGLTIKDEHFASCDTNGKCTLCDADFIDPDPNHHWDDSYKYDDTHHWRYCIVCNATSNKWEHAAACDNLGTCGSCGVEYSGDKLSHTCDYNTWYSDGTYHWRKCTKCDAEVYKNEHIRYCYNTTGECDRCGVKYDGDNIDHDYDFDTWRYDNVNHWIECTDCGNRASVREHYSDCDTNGTCNECKAPFTDPDPGHYFNNDIYESDETHHWNPCSECSSRVNESKHYRNCNDTPGKCSACGEAYTGTNIQHQWSNDYTGYDGTFHWRVCTLCNEKVGNPIRHQVSCSNPGNCTICGAPVTGDSFSAHNYSSEYTTDENYHWYVCLDCGATSTKNAHFGACSGSDKCTACNAKYTGDNHGSYTITRIDETYHEKICNDCGTHYDKEEHIASCTSNGLCSWCRSETTNTQIRHYTPWLEYGKDATYHWLLCNCCDEQVDKTAHTKTLVDHKAAGCATEGYDKYKCDTCQYEWTETIPATGNHELSYQTSETQHWQTCANCDYISDKVNHTADLIEETASYRKYQCSICQYEWTETISTECTHSWSVLSETAASCLTNGSITYKCSLCDETRTETLAASGAHTPVIDYGRSATCTQAGYTDGKRCSVCGEVLEERQQIAQLAHSWQQSSQTAPTCTANGSIVYTCSGCQGTYEESLSAIGHSYGAYQPAGDGTHVSVCANGCGDSKVRSCELENVTSGLFTYSTCKVCAYTTYSVKEAPAQDETSSDATATDDVSDETSAADTDAVESSAVESTVSVEAEKAILTLATEIAAAPEAVETVQIADATISVVSMDETAESSEASYIPEGAQLLVHEQSLPEEMTALPGAQMLHIALTVDGETVEHTGKVKVEIPTEQLQDTQDMSAMRLVLIANDGTMIEIPFEIIDGKLVFTTDMLGLFAFVPVEAA